MYCSPIGNLTLLTGPEGLRGVRFPGRGAGRVETGRRAGESPTPTTNSVASQLEEYFAGTRREFEVEMDLRGTAFQRSVWNELRGIPYGQTVSYGELTRRLGHPIEIVRDVAQAIGQTPVPIVVPCHRVIGADGSLTGYGGGLQRKEALLNLESRVAAGLAPQSVWLTEQLALI